LSALFHVENTTKEQGILMMTQQTRTG